MSSKLQRKRETDEDIETEKEERQIDMKKDLWEDGKGGGGGVAYRQRNTKTLK